MRRFALILICLAMMLGPTDRAAAQCNAGTDASIQVCSDGDALDLFLRLGGAPEMDGAWSNPAGGATTATFTPGADAAGAYMYVVSVNADGSLCGSPDTSFVTVNVTTVPTVSFSLNNTTGCSPVSVNFSDDTPPSNLSTYSWNFGDGSGSFDDSPFHTYQDTSGCFDVSLTLTNSTGCSATDTIFGAVCVQARPVSEFTVLTNPVFTSSPIARFSNQSTGATLYDWEVFGIGNFDDVEPEIPLPPFEADYNVCLDAMSPDGCVDRTCEKLKVRPPNDIFVPSAFTVNQDGLNEVFKPILSFAPDNYVFLVFDRDGHIIFESQFPSLGWNGNHQDSEFIVADGVYEWKVRTVKNAQIIERFGQVTVIR